MTSTDVCEMGLSYNFTACYYNDQLGGCPESQVDKCKTFAGSWYITGVICIIAYCLSISVSLCCHGLMLFKRHINDVNDVTTNKTSICCYSILLFVMCCCGILTFNIYYQTSQTMEHFCSNAYNPVCSIIPYDGTYILKYNTSIGCRYMTEYVPGYHGCYYTKYSICPTQTCMDYDNYPLQQLLFNLLMFILISCCSLIVYIIWIYCQMRVTKIDNSQMVKFYDSVKSYTQVI